MKRIFYTLALLFLAASCAHHEPKPDMAPPEVGSNTHITQAPPIFIREVSRQGNFFRIDQGSEQGVKLGDSFEVVAPGEQSLAVAEVVAIRPRSAFLRVKSASKDSPKLQKGLEVRPLASSKTL